jgi:phosphohistidine phosphatase
MELFLIRHAIAAEKSDPAFDHARPLTGKGRKRFEGVVRGLDALGIRFDRVYHSPWVRALQTAELCRPIGGELVMLDALAAPPKGELYDALRGDSIALVGHEPWMGELCSELVTGRRDLGAQFQFRKGGVAHLTGVAHPSGAALVALYPPGVLRAVAG